MTLGITGSNLSPNSFLLRRREVIEPSLIATVDYFSAATAGGANGNFSIAASTAGTAVFLSQIGTVAPLRTARLPTISITDNAFGSAIVITVRIVGKRFGQIVRQDITATSVNTAILTVAGTTVIDEITSATILSITNNTTSDILSIGFDGTRFGLQCPIRATRSVKFLEKIISAVANANSGAAAGSAGAIATSGTIRPAAVLNSSTYVKVADSSVDVAALFNSVAITANDRFIIDYIPDGFGDYQPFGLKYS